MSGNDDDSNFYYVGDIRVDKRRDSIMDGEPIPPPFAAIPLVANKVNGMGDGTDPEDIEATVEDLEEKVPGITPKPGVPDPEADADCCADMCVVM